MGPFSVSKHWVSKRETLIAVVAASAAAGRLAGFLGWDAERKC